MRIVGFLAAAAATAIWAGNFVASRALAGQIPPIQFNFWRWAIAFIVLLPFGLKNLGADWQIARQNLGYMSLMAIIGVTLMNAFIYQAGQTTESLNMALLMPATPAIVILLGHALYGDALPLRRIIGMLVSTMGIIIVISRGSWERIAHLHFQPGDIWTLGCMLCFALYSLFMPKRPTAISPVGFNIIVFGLGILYALPMCAVEIYAAGLPQLNMGVAIGVAYSGIGCSAIAFWLWTVAIDRIGAARSSLVYYLLPLFAAIMGRLVLDEQITSMQICGGTLIIGGIMVATMQIRKISGD